MRFSIATVLSASVAAISAATIEVQVGANGSLTYQPSSVNASTGDTIAFKFVGGNHTITQSTFATPCQALGGGVDSGFYSTNSSATQVAQYSFTLTNTSTPLWFYCRQTGHCQRGMVFAVNPTANKTFAAFQAAAEGNSSSSASTSTSSTSTSTSTAASSTHTSGAITMRDVGVTGFLVVVGLVMGLVE